MPAMCSEIERKREREREKERRLFKRCQNLSACTVLQWCRLFKLCQNLHASHCVAGVQAV